MSVLRSRKAWIAVAAAAAVVVTGMGAYLHFRPHEQPVIATATPPAVVVGAKTVAKTATAEFLTVIATSPRPGEVGVAVNSPVILVFNLPVDPATVQSSFSVLPDTPGTFSLGKTDTGIVFTPSKSLPAGASVSVVVRKGLTSRDGFVLQDDYSLSFLTQVAGNGVVFVANNRLARVANVQSGNSVNITLQLGNQVPSDVAVETFSATSTDMLTALVHLSNGQYPDSLIATASMHLLDTKGPVHDGDKLTITQPDGIYLLLAADVQGQYGSAWLDFSKYGVMLRQDDQKIVVAGEDLTSGDTTPSFNITFYNLQDSVHQVLAASFSGTGEFPAKYPSGIEVAVASSGGEDVVIPVSAPQTNADIKVVGDLAQQPQIFLTTDRAGYQQGDTAKFAGVVRLSNDQAYSVPSGMTAAVWAGQSASRLVDQKAAIAPDGTFSGSFPMPASVFNADGTDAPLTLYADVSGPIPKDFSSFSTLIGALGPHTPSGKLTVTLDKSSYVASDNIVASISGTDAKGQPLANQSLNLTSYSTQHQVGPAEMDTFPGPSTWGVPVQQNIKVQLDSAGHTIYSMSANAAQKAADQEITVAVTYGTGSAQLLGARTAVVYQAADGVFLLGSRSVYQSGELVTSPFVVEARGGDRVAGASMTYEFDKTDYQGSNATTTVVASGNVTTDSNGIGIVKTTYSGPTGGLVLRVKGKDQTGNTFEDTRWLNITDNLSPISSFGGTDALVRLGVVTDKIAYGVGDSAHLTVTSPTASTVLMSLERGRIHQYKWVTLAQGDNPLALTITPDLAPGFEVMFSYFLNGTFITEGLPISMNNSNSLLKVKVTEDKTSYAAGQTAHLSIVVTDNAGAPVAATLLVDAYDGSMSAYKLVDRAPIARAFLSPAVRGTNASSSLVGIGDWGGRCGGGMNPDQPAATNPGHLAAWLTGVSTDASGHATVDVPITQGTVRVALIANALSSTWGQVETDLPVQ